MKLEESIFDMLWNVPGVTKVGVLKVAGEGYQAFAVIGVLAKSVYEPDLNEYPNLPCHKTREEALAALYATLSAQ